MRNVAIADRAGSDFDDEILHGVIVAGEPFYSEMYGDAKTSSLRRCIDRPWSEVFKGRCRILKNVEGRMLGGYIGLGAAELSTARSLDALIYVKEAADGTERRRRMQFLHDSRSLFGAVDPNSFYLSKIWVTRSARGRGYARDLLSDFVERAEQAGFKGVALDVAVGPLESLYRGFGLETFHRGVNPCGKLRYQSMWRAIG